MIIDDGSDTRPRIDSRLPVRILRQENAGPAAAINYGAEVAAGTMVLAANLSTALGLAPVQDAQRLASLLDHLHLPTRLPRDSPPGLVTGMDALDLP